MSFSKSKTFVKIIVIAIFLNIVFSVSTTIVIQWLLNNSYINQRSMGLYFSVFISFLLTIICILISISFKRGFKSIEHVKELKNFRDFTDALNTSKSENEVHEILHNFIRNVIPSKQINLFYRDVKSSNEVIWQRIGSPKVPLCNMSHKNCPVVLTGRECIVNNIEEDIICAYQSDSYKCGSYICLSIIEQGKLIGVLQLQNNDKFFFSDSLITKIKSYIGIAVPVITNKRTLNTLNKEALTDKLTKIYNRSFLDPYLENQIESTKISSKPLSIIMLDIDHFKRINDTYGHPAGDAILVLFAQLILRCLRKTDTVARYGGEEFMAILPATDIETARIIAERIRETVSQEKMPTFNKEALPYISCSLGVSSYPILSNSKSELVNSADIALYKAKQSGRNCVKVYNKEMQMEKK